MERLSDTVIEIVNELHRERLDYKSEYVPLIDALNRLAAYEDTGLEPEEVAYFLGTTMSVKEAKTQYAEHKKRYDEWFAWKQAEQEGRLQVLPCKVGDPVYYLTGNPILASGYHFNRVESTKCIGFYFDEKGLQICLFMPHGNHGTYGYFGKTIFRTREEAKAKLKEFGE